MAIRTNKAQKINGVDYPAGMAIIGLDKRVEALAAEGGGATPVNLAVFEVNSSGQPVDANGNPVSGAGSVALRSALFVGDSITSYAEVTLAMSGGIVNLGGGLARITHANHSLSVGQKVRTAAAAALELNVLSATVIAVTDASNAVVSLDGPVHQVTGNAPVIAFVDRASTRGWVNWLETFAGQPLARTWAAVAGATIDTCADLLVKLPAGQEDLAILAAGMNDIYSRGKSLAAMQADFPLLVAAVKRRSSRLVCLSVPPRNSADPAWTAGRQAIHTAWNRWLYDQCAANGWEYVDTWAATQDGATYVNAAAANPDPLAAMVHDNTHPSMRGAAALGAAVWAKVSKWFGVQGWRAPHAAAIGSDAGNLLTNSAFTTDAAGVATSWVREPNPGGLSAVFTRVARTIAADGDACGGKQVMTLNSSAGATPGDVRFRRYGIQALLTAGQRYYMAVPFKVTGAVGLTGLELSMFGSVDGGSSFWLIFGHNQDSNSKPMTGAFGGVLLTPIATCPPGLSNLDVWVRPYINAAQAADVVIEVWQPQLRLVA